MATIRMSGALAAFAVAVLMVACGGGAPEEAGPTCFDITCDYPSVCTDESGDARCICAEGYADPEGDGSCADVDECASGAVSCVNATCVNYPGTYVCRCSPGYADQGAGCVDVDECATGVDDCGAHATCTDTDGGFTCACDAPFQGDGRTCQLTVEMTVAGAGGSSFARLVAESGTGGVFLRGYDAGGTAFVPYGAAELDCAALAVAVVGTPGDDTIDLRNCTRPVTVHGDLGGDVVNGGSANDTLYGEGDADVLYGNGGDDTLYGGDGSDQIVGGAGSRNALYGEGGDDFLFSCGFYDIVDGGPGADSITIGGACP